MYNFQKIQNATMDDLIYLFNKADLTKGKKGRKLRKAVSWLLEEVY